MNNARKAALRRLGLALVASGTLSAGVVVAQAQGSPQDADQTAAAPVSPDAAAPDAAPPPVAGGHEHRFGDHRFGPGGAHRWGPEPRMWRHRGFGPEHGMRMDRGFFAAMRQLNLTPVQREQMRAIVFNAREAVRMERANEQQSGAAERKREDFAVLSNPGDPAYAHAVQQLKGRVAEQAQQAVTRASDTEQKLYNVLTAEQKAQLPKVLSDLRARHEQRMQVMRMHRENRGTGPGMRSAAPPPLPQ